MSAFCICMILSWLCLPGPCRVTSFWICKRGQAVTWSRLVRAVGGVTTCWWPRCLACCLQACTTIADSFASLAKARCMFSAIHCYLQSSRSVVLLLRGSHQRDSSCFVRLRSLTHWPILRCPGVAKQPWLKFSSAHRAFSSRSLRFRVRQALPVQIARRSCCKC